MARVSIYVSDELKSRMTEAGDTLNWSDIARPAFEAAIANLNHRKGQSMTTAIERLRASKMESEQEASTEGKEAGRSWATDKASYRELKAVSLLDLSIYDHHPENVGAAIKGAVDPHEHCDYQEVAQDLFGEDAWPEDVWLLAWAEGAQEVFEEVSDQL